ncbi:hypothetical protein ABFS83_03G019900 [Erythranthe nasuta]
MSCYALRRKNLAFIFPNNFSSQFAFSISLLYFSTSSCSKPTAPAVYDLLVQKHKLSHVVASHVSSVLAFPKTPENWDSIISFFKGVGFTDTQLERILKIRPRLLSASLERTIQPKIAAFKDVGFSDNDIADIISKVPAVLHSSTNNKVVPALSLLRGMFGSNEEVTKVLRKSGWLLLTDLNKNMVPNIIFLKSCGVSTEQINMIFKYLPRFFISKQEIVRRCVKKVDEMGVDRRSKMFVYAVAIVGSMTNGTWELKLDAFRNILGFSEDDILRTVRQMPQAFSVSEDKIKKVKEVVLSTGKYDASCFVRNPKLLMHSIEKRYKPRFEALGILESRGVIKKWPCLTILSKMTDDTFFNEFVAPYTNEVGDDLS